jgi:pimeloyl-ACP methyl ester carboxylesterase
VSGRDGRIRLSDGRILAYREWGRRSDPAIFLLHGTPLSRLYVPTDEPEGVHLVTVDRPGFGGSDVQPARTVAMHAKDVLARADALEVERFAVLGWSGGGPYAAACVAVMPSRLISAGIAHSRSFAAYHDLYERPDPESKLEEDDLRVFEAIRTGSEHAFEVALSEPGTQGLAQSPESAVEQDDTPEVDRWIFADEKRRSAFLAALREAFRQGPAGLAWEWVAQLSPWGFRLEDISLDLHIWHGAHDRRVSLPELQAAADRLTSSHLTVWRDTGHGGLEKHWDAAVAALLP